MSRSASAATTAAAAANAALLSNTNLYTLSANHHDYLVSGLLSASGYTSTNDGGTFPPSRYGHRREFELRPIESSLNPLPSASSSSVAVTATGSSVVVVDHNNSTSLDQFKGQGFVAMLLNRSDGNSAGVVEAVKRGSFSGLAAAAAAAGTAAGTSSPTTGRSPRQIASKPPTPTITATTASTAAPHQQQQQQQIILSSAATLLRQIDAFESFLDDEVSSIRNFYGFGPTGSRKRARVISEADRINAASSATNPFVLSKRALIAEFSLSGGPTTTSVGGAAGVDGTAGGAIGSAATAGSSAAVGSSAGGVKSPSDPLFSPTAGGPSSLSSNSLVGTSYSSAAFASPPATQAAVTAANAAVTSAAASSTNNALACEVAKTLPITCPDSISVTAVQKLAIDLSHYGAACAVSRRQPYAGRAYVVGVEEGLDAIIPPTAGGAFNGVVTEGALGTSVAVTTAATGRSRKRGAGI